MPPHTRERYITTIGGASLTLRITGSYRVVEHFVARIGIWQEAIARAFHWLLGVEALVHLDQSSSEPDEDEWSGPYP